MKKLIVLLLALAMVGAVSAQVTTSVALSGEVTLVDQAGNGVFTDYGNGYDTLTLKGSEKDGKYGFSATFNNVLDAVVAPTVSVTVAALSTPTAGTVAGDLSVFGGLRDWNVWGKVLGGKLSVGSLRNATFRLTLPYWAGATVFGGTDRISGYGVLYESTAKNGLTFGVNLPYSTTSGAALNVLKKADVGLKYDIAKVGTFIALANLDLVTPANVVNAGFKYTGTKDLTATVLAQGKFDANTYKASAGFAYTGVKKLTANLEGAFTSTAGVTAYSVWAQGAYAVTDLVTATVGGSYASAGYDAYGTLAYSLGNGFSVDATVGFNAALYAAANLYYSVSF